MMLRPQTCAFKLPEFKLPEHYFMELRSSGNAIYPNRSLFHVNPGNALAPGFALRDAALGLDGCPRNFIGPLQGRAGFVGNPMRKSRRATESEGEAFRTV